MADPKVVLPDALKRLEFCVHNIEEALFWMAQQVVGHPKAQDFEPTGHGGSDPTGVAGTLQGGDRAAATGKELHRRMRRLYDEVCWMERTVAANLGAERPKFDPTDPNEYCRMHLLLDEYLYRYRGDRCRSCYERVLTLRDNGLPDDITLDDLRHHQRVGQWPRKAVDPKAPSTAQPLPGEDPRTKREQRRVAGLDNLVDGLATIQEAQ